jgi:hypothetical protein
MHYNDRTIDNPSWDEIESAIRDLDGEDVHLSGPANASMTIGGKGNRYFAQVTLDGKHFHYVIVAPRSTKLVSIVVGGQRIEMEEHKVSKLPDVIKATRAFVDNGCLSSEVEWERG